jgi:hypothetical protein
MLKDGSVDHTSFVPDPISLSSAASEMNAATVGIMSAACTHMIYLELLMCSPDHPYTIPIFSDCSASITIACHERSTHWTCHIACCYCYCCQANIAGDVDLLHLNGDKYQLANLGTNNVSAFESAYKLSLIEVPLPGPMAIVHPPITKLKRGDSAEGQANARSNKGAHDS